MVENYVFFLCVDVGRSDSKG